MRAMKYWWGFFYMSFWEHNAYFSTLALKTISNKRLEFTKNKRLGLRLMPIYLLTRYEIFVCIFNLKFMIFQA